jgi:hypothetical protein
MRVFEDKPIITDAQTNPGKKSEQFIISATGAEP